jgi:DNA-binding beta-propeller fold protein YncE
LPAAPAAAGTVTDERPLLFSFDGSDSSLGHFTAPLSLAVDNVTQNVYVLNGGGSGKGPGPFDAQRVVCKFDAEGKAQSFTGGSSAGKSCLDGKDTPGKAFGVEGFFGEGAFTADIAIDNSGGAGKPGEGEQGRIYVSEAGGPIHAFAADGTYRWTLSRAVASPCGIAVDAEGHLWVGNGDAAGEDRFKTLEFDSTGATAPVAPVDSVTFTNSTKRPCRLAIDMSGKNLYAGLAPESPSGVDKYVEGKYDSTFDTGYHEDVTVDQSKASGHIFLVNDTYFSEYEPCEIPACAGKKVAGSPFGGDLIGTAQGIAHNPTLDWVYVSDRASNTVKVFGPVKSGTVPDVSCQATTEIALHTAKANCTINPLSLPNSYHFEWKLGTDESWGAAKSSPAQSIEPTDSNPHAVSLALIKLKSNATYQVRLVGTSTENDLNSYSAPDTFTTPKPPAPDVKECAVSEVTTESAHVACTIDPVGEETDWQVETSTDPACATGFVSEPQQTIPEGEAGTVGIEWDLEGLLPAQHYCVRVSASGPGGSDSETKELKTPAIPPSEASAAFAAPRTDTTARINARINPNGEADLSYRFEVSEDDVNWTVLPIRVSTIDAREPIVVAEELAGLEADAEYHYRLGLTENEAGPAASLGEEKSFRTRTSAEVEAAQSLPSCPNEDVRAAQHTTQLGSCRGIELVNNPDKGNQTPLAAGPLTRTPPMSADGEKVLWSVGAGAPGGPNGTESNFLAERGGSGWESKSVAPPAEEQVGGGDFAYHLGTVTPDFGSFVFAAMLSTGLAEPPSPTVVRVRAGKQDALKAYEVQAPNLIYQASVELSDDGEHVLYLDAGSKQLEDIGAARVGPPEVPAETVSLMPGGLPSICGLETNNGESFVQGALYQPGYHWAASTDASRVYFRAPANGDCGGLYRLWVRNRDAGTTTEIDPGAFGQAPEFIRATPDGRQAYFRTSSNLDPADLSEDANGIEPDPVPEADVYRWDEEAGKSSCLTCVVPDANLAKAGSGAIAAVLISEDFSHIYFQSKERLDGQGVQGNMNIYALSGGEVSLITSVDTGQDLLERPGRPGLSTDGNVLLFRAPAGPSLTADEMAAQCNQATAQPTLGPCTELYRYDDRDASLECISCRHGETTSSSVGPAGGLFNAYRLSGDGATVAFVTQQALLDADVNQDTDVYEWRAGVRSLVSDGVSDFQVELTTPQVMAVDGDGSDILFALVPPGGKLTGYEQDRVLNLYDARIGGGFMPPTPDVHCVEDACQGPLQGAPTVESGTSATFSGSGNVKQAKKRPCAKKRGKAKRRCLKRQRARARRARARQARGIE